MILQEILLMSIACICRNQNVNALIDNKSIFEQPVKNKQESYEKLFEMLRNNYHTTGNWLDYLYQQNYYKLVDKDLSRQTNITIPQKINSTGSLEQVNVAAMFCIVILYKTAKEYSKLFFRFINCNRRI